VGNNGREKTTKRKKRKRNLKYNYEEARENQRKQASVENKITSRRSSEKKGKSGRGTKRVDTRKKITCFKGGGNEDF